MKVLMLEAGSQIDPARIFITHSCIRWTIAGRANRDCCAATAVASGTTASCSITKKIRTRLRPERCTVGDDRACLGGRTPALGARQRSHGRLRVQSASRDGYGMDWAISYADMKPYYDRVESFIGVSAATRRLAAVSRRRFPPAHAFELRRNDFYRGVPRVSAGRPRPAASRN